MRDEPSRPPAYPPSDRDPMDQIRSNPSQYLSTIVSFAKKPPVSRKSTRSPLQFKNNYKIALGFMFRPLDFSEIELAVQEIEFCMLTPVV